MKVSLLRGGGASKLSSGVLESNADATASRSSDPSSFSWNVSKAGGEGGGPRPEQALPPRPPTKKSSKDRDATTAKKDKKAKNKKKHKRFLGVNLQNYLSKKGSNGSADKKSTAKKSSSKKGNVPSSSLGINDLEALAWTGSDPTSSFDNDDNVAHSHVADADASSLHDGDGARTLATKASTTFMSVKTGSESHNSGLRASPRRSDGDDNSTLTASPRRRRQGHFSTGRSLSSNKGSGDVDSLGSPSQYARRRRSRSMGSRRSGGGGLDVPENIDLDDLYSEVDAEKNRMLALRIQLKKESDKIHETLGSELDGRCGAEANRDDGAVSVDPHLEEMGHAAAEGEDADDDNRSKYSRVSSLSSTIRRRSRRSSKRLSKQEKVSRIRKMRRENRELQHNKEHLERQLNQAKEVIVEIEGNAQFKLDALETELRDHSIGTQSLMSASTAELDRRLEAIHALSRAAGKQKDRIHRQRQVLSETQKELHEAKLEVVELEKERQKSADENDKVKSELRKMMKKNVKLRMDLDSKSSRLERVHDKNKQDKEQVLKLRLELDQLRDQIEMMQKDAADKDERIASLEQTVKIKNEEVESAISDLASKKRSVARLELELTQTKSDLKSAKRELKKREAAAAAVAKKGGHDPPAAAWENLDDNDSVAAVSVQSDGSALAPRRQRKGLFLKLSSENITDDPPPSSNDSVGSVDRFAAQMRDRNERIDELEKSSKTNNATIAKLRSDLVRLNSQYKQDAYLKDKKIKKLVHENAAYKIKVKVLESEFHSVNANSVVTHGVGDDAQSVASRESFESMADTMSVGSLESCETAMTSDDVSVLTEPAAAPSDLSVGGASHSTMPVPRTVTPDVSPRRLRRGWSSKPPAAPTSHERESSAEVKELQKVVKKLKKANAGMKKDNIQLLSKIGSLESDLQVIKKTSEAQLQDCKIHIKTLESDIESRDEVVAALQDLVQLKSKSGVGGCPSLVQTDSDQSLTVGSEGAGSNADMALQSKCDQYDLTSKDLHLEIAKLKKSTNS